MRSSSLWLGAHPLILASKSTARQALLRDVGICFEVLTAKIDERAIEAPLQAQGASPSQIALHLARAKALSVSVKRPNDYVLGADQILSLAGRIFHKPRDHAHAMQQLITLSGKTHNLHSAFALVKDGKVIGEDKDDAHLRMRHLSADFLQIYLAAAGPEVLNCVGVYQLEAVGQHLFDRIEGDHSTILGLPLLPLLHILRHEGLIVD